MKKSIFKRLVSGAVSAFLTMAAVIPATGFAENPDYQETFKKDGYDYELWNQYGQGTTKFDAGSNGTYSCEWNGIHNILFRAGKKWDNNPQWDTLDGIAVDYSCDYNPNGNSYLCIYGWTVDPLVEYYICDTYGSWRPPGSDFQKMGTIKVDGGTYEVYSGEHDGPSIDPNVTHFKQYWSVRVDSDLRSEGTITVSDHFKAWEQYNMQMGGLHEVALNVEGWESSGKANVTKNDLRIGDGSGGDPTIVDDKPGEITATPDENGCYFTSDFEGGKDKWTARGDATLSNDTKNYYSGNSSLYVSGRTKDWNGAALSLPTDAFVAGNTYSISLAALQKSGSAQEMKLTLEYTNASGEKGYSTVASAEVNSGEWTKLENTSYTIPTGASDLLLYIEATDPQLDFYIDTAIGAVEGTDSSVVTGQGTVEGKTSEVTTIPETTTSAPAATTTAAPVSERLWGDANLDDKVSISDAVRILQYVANGNKYDLEGDARLNADVYNNGDGVTGKDAQAIQKFDAGLISSLPESYMDGRTPETPVATTPAETSAPEEEVITGEGSIYNISFDKIGDDITTQGDVTLTTDSDNYYSGNSSAKVSGRTDSWQGIAKVLSNDFSAGKTYSFSAAVMQASGSSVDFALTLQYDGADGKTNYDNIASVNAKSGEWTKIENTSFKIPEGASNLKVYVETPDSKTDYYVDDFMGANEGTKSSVVTGNGVVTAKAPEVTPRNTDGVDISWIDPSKPMVAISFDDGAKSTDPSSSSMRIINAIADSGFHSTFFYVGNWINDSNKGEVEYAYSKGMEIANHSTTHPKLSEKSKEEIRSEFDTTHAKLKSIIGAEPSKIMRLPYLDYNSDVLSVLNDVALITCSIDTGDWNKATTQDIISKITNAMNDGSLNNSIVLCHETYDTTAEAIEYLAPYLKSQGWQIVTVSELFAVRGQELKGGTVYSKCN